MIFWVGPQKIISRRSPVQPARSVCRLHPPPPAAPVRPRALRPLRPPSSRLPIPSYCSSLHLRSRPAPPRARRPCPLPSILLSLPTVSLTSHPLCHPPPPPPTPIPLFAMSFAAGATEPSPSLCPPLAERGPLTPPQVPRTPAHPPSSFRAIMGAVSSWARACMWHTRNMWCRPGDGVT